MGIIKRHAPTDARRPRKPLLGVRRGHEIASLAGEQSDITGNDEDAQLFAEWLMVERNRWDVRRRQGTSGIFANHKRWDRRDAERAWSAVCSKQRENA
jgi:hypothetical protein